ncbi:hypothetical protein O7614_31810 [Micromonospora sp. WMMD961]|uniref:hypothetical protein n=1 Tax=Micromonospora sp. WMMD961 TaxID=3016100 RepID=UPI0024161D9D|nr:hypothetical protein [Micromonospora sp. WMMD961]MDG4784250.1 hypothetical protein [Micromonospora sp. WMMD961]
MPAPVTSDARRQPPLLTMLFWAGVALAPVAALILLVADGNGPLRFAAVLAIVAVVLIGLSIALRPDAEGASARADELLDEMEELRRELRAEIVAAAQRGNQALDQAQRAQEGIAAVRRRLDASGAALAGAVPAGEPAGAGRARVPAAEPPMDDVPVARSRVQAPGDAPAGRARVAGPGDAPRRGRSERMVDDESAYPREAAEPPAAAGMYGAERSAGTAYGSARPREHDRPEPAHRPAGVVRHTETVHVTTRHTVVDGGHPEPAGRFGGGYGSQWTPPAQEWSRGAERHTPDFEADESGWTGRPDEPEWTDPRDAYAHADEPGPARSHRTPERPASRSWDDPDDRGWSEQRDRTNAAAPQPGPPLRADDTGEYWSQLRAGDRWAAVRDDENGRELRVGERRAEVHADASGTEYRMADRWAAVRHEEPRRHEEPEAYHWDEPARRHDRDGGWRGESAGRPALPEGGVPVPDEWRPPRQRGHQAEPAPERPGRRRVDERYGYPPQDDVPRAGGTPPGDRWR